MSGSTPVKMPHCWKSHVAAHILYSSSVKININCLDSHLLYTIQRANIADRGPVTE